MRAVGQLLTKQLGDVIGQSPEQRNHLALAPQLLLQKPRKAKCGRWLRGGLEAVLTNGAAAGLGLGFGIGSAGMGAGLACGSPEIIAFIEIDRLTLPGSSIPCISTYTVAARRPGAWPRLQASKVRYGDE